MTKVEEENNYTRNEKIAMGILFFIMYYTYVISPFLYIRRVYGEKESNIALVFMISLIIYMKKAGDTFIQNYGAFIFFILLPIAIISTIIDIFKFVF
jgi:hypothetical protein